MKKIIGLIMLLILFIVIMGSLVWAEGWIYTLIVVGIVTFITGFVIIALTLILGE